MKNKNISPSLRSLLCLIALVLTTTMAKAEIVEMEDGGSYAITAFQPWQGSFQASTDGILTLTAQDLITYYGTDATFTNISTDYTHAYVNGKNQAQVIVNAGNTYYFMFSFPMNDQTLTVSLKDSADGKVKLIGIEPKEGSTLDVTDIAQINVTFDTQVHCSSAILSAGASVASLTTEAAQNYICATYKNELFGWLKSGAVKEGDDVTLTISGIRSTLNNNLTYGEDGILSATFKAPAKPVELVSAKYPHSMQAYWEPGDADGIVILTFDGNLYEGDDPSLKPGINLTFGNIESDKYKIYHDFTYAVSGNTITIDLTGVNRELPVGNDDDENYFVLSIDNVHDANGKSVYSTGAGTIGSFAFTMGFQISAVDVITEFTPAGGSLDGVNSIELWIRGVSAIRYNGVEFNYEKGGIRYETIIPQEKLTIDSDVAEDEATITIPVPTAIKTADAGTTVTVSLNGLHCLDGVERKISAIYTAPENNGDEFFVELLTPAEGSTLEALVEDEWIIVKPSLDCYLEYRIDDLTNKEVLKSSAWLNQLDNGTYGAQFPITMNLTKGHEFAIVVTGWTDEQTRWTNELNTLGEFSFTIYGNGKTFEYSTLELVRIYPNPDDFEILAIEDTDITVTFSGTVSDIRAGVTTQGFGLDQFPAMPSNEDGSEWTITIPAYVIAQSTSYLNVMLFALDEFGRPLVGDFGVENDSHWELNYVCTAGSPDLIVTPAEGEVKSISEIHIGYENGLSSLYNYMAGNIILYKGKGNDQIVVGEWDSNYFDIANESIYKIDGENIVEWTLLTRTTITDPGTYTLVIPSSFFSLGNGMMNYNNKNTIVTYTIADGGSADVTIIFDPAEGSTVDKLHHIKLTFPDTFVVTQTWNATAEVRDAQGNKICEVWGNKQYGDPANVMPIVLEEKIIEKGEYTIHIPADWMFYDETGNQSNKAIDLTYFVSGNYNPNDDPDNPDNKEIKVVSLTYSTDVEGSSGMYLTLNDCSGSVLNFMGSAVIKNADEETVISSIMVFPYWDQSMYELVFIDGDLTTSGNYTLEIGAGTFSHFDKALTVNFTFDAEIGKVTLIPATGIGTVQNIKDAMQSVYTINGVKIEGNKTRHGLIIVNGKKHVVK